MEILKRLLRIAGIFILLLLIICLFIFTWIDRTPYQETEFYEETLNGLASINPEEISSIGDSIHIGWAKASLVPTNPTPMAGYGARHGAKYNQVHDSIWVKSFVFDNGKEKHAFVSMDLLIVPMEVQILMEDLLDSLDLKKENLFYSASHSHCSIGGWGKGIAGELFAGPYNDSLVNFIAFKTAESLEAAMKNMKICSIGYSETDGADLVTNRLVGDQKGGIDRWIRTLKFRSKDGETAILSVFAAHSTCLSHHFMDLSGDYPGQLCRNLEQLEGIDFAVFSAGAMGSMAPLIPERIGWERVEYFAEQLTQQISIIQNFMPLHYDSLLGSANVDLYLRDPQFKVSENMRVRPWVFNELFGGYPSKITSFRLGDVLFVGTPCDFSGELVEQLSVKARDKNLYLIITSFNGGYTGYITKDEWYDLDEYETRVMNWFGPYNGAYFSEVIERIIDLHAESIQR